MSTQEVMDKIKECVLDLEREQIKKGKAAAKRARAQANTLKKLASEYKKASLAELKADA